MGQRLKVFYYCYLQMVSVRLVLLIVGQVYLAQAGSKYTDDSSPRLEVFLGNTSISGKKRVLSQKKTKFFRLVTFVL